MPSNKNYKAFRVGPLPAEPINEVLGTELEIADIWVSKACHKHIATDHPDDYALIKANLIDIIRSPGWVGQDPHNGKNFYLVKRVEDIEGMTPVLVAIGLELSSYGTYNVRSAYSISEETLNNRRLRGSLRPIYPK